MENETSKWSPAYLLITSGPHPEVSSKPGVYRIRAYTKHRGPLPIPRLAGVDPLGILHIGQSDNLRRRIRYFRGAALGKKYPHKAGREFSEWHFANLIPLESLRFDCIETSTEQEALKLERVLHVEYRRKFLDRPPLDSTSGRAGA